jgi:hypothetical protein
MKKRLILVILVATLLFVFPALAFQGSVSSGEKTSSSAIYAGSAWITGVEVITDGTNDAKLILYDNATAATGKVILEMTVIGSANFGGREPGFPPHCYNGIYGAITGTGASFIVEYIEK